MLQGTYFNSVETQFHGSHVYCQWLHYQPQRQSTWLRTEQQKNQFV